MSSIVKYRVYLARVHFIEANAFKLRPVIAVSRPVGTHDVVTVIPVFSRNDSEAVDVVLKNWRAIGLSRPSVARVHRLTAMAKVDLLEELGRLDSRDITLIKTALTKHLEL